MTLQRVELLMSSYVARTCFRLMSVKLND